VLGPGPDDLEAVLEQLAGLRVDHVVGTFRRK
jgi:hypothetical protein